MEPLPLVDQLRKWYYTPTEPSALGGASKLVSAAGKHHEADTRKWLSTQDANTLHKPYRRRFLRRKTVVGGAGQQLQADLLDVSNISRANGGVKFILTALDVFSRKGFARGLRSKRGEDVAAELDKILKDSGSKTLQTDKGKEFYNAHVQRVFEARGIHHFSTDDDETKASMVERFNKTLREMMGRYMTFSRNSKFTHILPDLVEGYNDTANISTGVSPNEIRDNQQEDIFLRMWNPGVKTHASRNLRKLSAGD